MDFFHIHTQLVAEGVGHAGIVLSRQQHYSVGEQMRPLLKMMALRSAADMRDHAEFLSGWG